MSYGSKLRAIIGKSVLLVMLLVYSSSVYAQTGYTIHGQVMDAITGQPIPFVTLSVANGQVSNETNSQGYFELSIPQPLKQDTLSLLALNYQLKQVPLLRLALTDTLIRLNALQVATSPTDTYFSLEKSFQARDTLLKAVGAIGKNYTRKPTLLRGFYRETINEQSPNLCVSYAEGLIDIYKPAYSFTKKSDQIHFIKGQRKPLTAFKIPVLTPGPWGSNMLDIVKYQEFLFRNGQLNKDYIFELTSQTMIGGQWVYVINFKPRSFYKTSGYFVGRLFLTKEGLAIVRAEYELAERGLSLLNKSLNNQVYSTHLSKRSYVANYSKFGDSWSFQSGSIENTFSHIPSSSAFQSRIDFVVTRRQEGDDDTKPFTADQLVDYSKMTMSSFDQTSATFWKEENYLLPTLPLPALLTGSTDR
ncbi:carboxypeptidase-like regulatory domain-containing protein [Spirosoma fluviale]|uniref:CarboxypepD_reg-like domain-containing protein n=1 Tax=Spirosoma fluviale TaxID=1597977 RepID=A0A286GJS9_9BACT|nr:hypothetical protein [Spirosoma fluviale]SOD95244.1 hypothetical protein SAMN06269250_4791 [Spirosoma fluviale]